MLAIMSAESKTDINRQKYAILMSVYSSENPEWFRLSIDSILDQTLPPAEFVLVCDGPLNASLESVISALSDRLGSSLKLIRLAVNQGLGPAMNKGLEHCSCDWIARMDSDDIARPDRCERQLAFAAANDLDVVSCWVEEFAGDQTSITGQRRVPEKHDVILRTARKRNPINHPGVMYKAKSVRAAGGYRNMPRFEDYDLWVRLLLNGARMGNLQAPLLFMRAGSEMSRRRGGWEYCRDIIRFFRAMRQTGFIGRTSCLASILFRSAVSLIPNALRHRFYQKRLRKADLPSEGVQNEKI